MKCKYILQKLTLLSFLIALLYPTILLCQDSTDQRIKNILLSANQKFAEANYNTSLEKSHDALELLSKSKNNDLKRKAKIYAAKSLIEIGLIQKALVYLNDAEELNKNKFNLNVKIEIHRLRGRAYALLNLDNAAFDEFQKQKYHSRFIKDSTEKNLSLFWSYENLSEIFERKKWNDSIKIYLKEQQRFLSKTNSSNHFYYESSIHTKLGHYFLNNREIDSAEKHLNQALNILVQNKANFYFNVLIPLAEVKISQNKTAEAIDHYHDALKNAQELNDQDAIYGIYKKLSDLYIDKNINLVQARDYLIKANTAKAKLENSNKHAVDLALKTIIKNKETEITKRFHIIITTSLITLVTVALILFIIIRKRKKHLQKKNRELLNFSNTIENNNNESKFKDLICLAKSNSPEFLLVFKELYPDFIHFIRDQDPKVRSSELTFLALTFLNFSTKDISEYTFVTVRAVQVRKNRLRKKYNIPSEYDFNTWMRLHGKVLCVVEENLVSQN